jgi:hypothetical protein
VLSSRFSNRFTRRNEGASTEPRLAYGDSVAYLDGQLCSVPQASGNWTTGPQPSDAASDSRREPNEWLLGLEVVERELGILADLDEVAVGIAHLATPFPSAVIQRFSEENRSFCTPFLVTSPDVCNARVEETADSVAIR